MGEIAVPKVTPHQKSFLGFTAEFGYFGPQCGWSWKAPGIGFGMAENLTKKGLLFRDTKAPENMQPCWKLTALGMHMVKALKA